ncbi:glucosamine-6-phosphate deaminase [Paenibacillus sp. UNCCL117]|uniref:glucosamine-6-phosphate deaminase n=1 Tax=unclassified Paenibacillus TaxID=185978 RepID=UPI00088D4E14|nr:MULTISPECIES: glucosamine-6-phosphate deaminase [unclassified Paenibacillus]SDC66919.1 glucosamine-6-phosphate deaminase [Paenibacillus sp. cl123]SFW23175.1 glucosamine-6-phosphate deaminase [Paenibacillus sp. UNCCL117]
MQLTIKETADQIGLEAAIACRQIIQEAIQKQGSARIVLSTGASQFEFLQHFVKMDVEWDKVEMFHLDEYIALPEAHPASFRKYLKERFLAYVNVKQAWLVDGEGDPAETLKRLNEEIVKAPVDLALIGIGENAHIAFNDPPADFDVEDPYIVVDLSDTCKNQQVGEGWFATTADVPKQAITMSVKQIMKSRHIVSVVPRPSKSQAIADMMKLGVDCHCPATMLKTHPSWELYLDKHSASQVYTWC